MYRLSDNLKATYNRVKWMKYNFRKWFLDIFANRDTLKNYEGHGNMTEERGWWFIGQWIPYNSYKPNEIIDELGD